MDQCTCGGASHSKDSLGIYSVCRKITNLVSLIVRLHVCQSNILSGELEATIHGLLVRGSNLKRWLSRSTTPPVIRQCKLLYDKFFGTQGNDHRSGKLDVPPEDEEYVSYSSVLDDLRPLLLKHQKRVRLCARHWAHGVVFARESTHI